MFNVNNASQAIEPPRQEGSSFDQLPPEIPLSIFSNLTSNELLQLRVASKRFYALVSEYFKTLNFPPTIYRTYASNEIRFETLWRLFHSSPYAGNLQAKLKEIVNECPITVMNKLKSILPCTEADIGKILYWVLGVKELPPQLKACNDTLEFLYKHIASGSNNNQNVKRILRDFLCNLEVDRMQALVDLIRDSTLKSKGYFAAEHCLQNSIFQPSSMAGNEINLGLSQADIDELLGMSPSELRIWEVEGNPYIEDRFMNHIANSTRLRLGPAGKIFVRCLQAYLLLSYGFATVLRLHDKGVKAFKDPLFWIILIVLLITIITVASYARSRCRRAGYLPL